MAQSQQFESPPLFQQRALRPVSLRRGDVLAETRTPVEYVYFPYSGIISLVVEMSEET